MFLNKKNKIKHKILYNNNSNKVKQLIQMNNKMKFLVEKNDDNELLRFIDKEKESSLTLDFDLNTSIKDGKVRKLISTLVKDLKKTKHYVIKNNIKFTKYIRKEIENNNVEKVQEILRINSILLEHLKLKTEVIDKLIEMLKSNKIVFKNYIDLSLNYYLYALEIPTKVLKKYLTNNLENGEHVHYNYLVEELDSIIIKDELGKSIKRTFDSIYDVINLEKYYKNSKEKIR